jgi:hypothetical protein
MRAAMPKRTLMAMLATKPPFPKCLPLATCGVVNRWSYGQYAKDGNAHEQSMSS